MKKHYLFFKSQFIRCVVIGLVAALFPLNQVLAQALTGIKTIPGTYSSLALAVADLNANGVGTGGVTFNLSAGYNEVLTSGLVVTATGTAANPIVFQKSGIGANPEIKAFPGSQLASSTTAIDIMLAFVGSDYVTIDGIDLNEVPANNTATLQMEVGYGFYKASGTDGTNNNTVKNCMITLNRNNVTASASTGPRASTLGSVGIEVVACTPTATGTIIPVSVVSGASSNNKFYGNTIQNVNFGISLSGDAATSPYTLADLNNDIGGASMATGNTIINFGGGNGAAGACGAVCVRNQWSFNVSYNTINNNDGAGVNHPNSNRGIWLHASSVGASCEVNNNKITISGATTSSINWCIDVEMAQSGANGNVINIKNNQFLKCNVTTAATAGFTAIWLATSATTVNVTNNYIYGYTYAGTATSQAITVQSGSIGTLNVLNNTIDSTVLTGASGSFYNIGALAAVTEAFNINGNNITRTIVGSGTKTLYGIFYNSATPAVNILDNNINNISRTGTSGGTTMGIYISGGTTGSSTITVKRNTINDINVAATAAAAAINGIQLTSGTLICDSNTIYNLSCTGTAAMYGIYVSSTSNNENYNYNKIYSLSHLGTGATYGIYCTTTAGVRTVSRNAIYTISGAGTVAGVYQASSVPNVFSNKIYDLSTSSTSAVVSGIIMGSPNAGTAQVSNNLIAGLTASVSNGGATATIRGIDITATAASTTIGVYHNTVYLNATSTGAAFSSTGIYHTYSATATSASLDMRNNIIVNTSTPTGATGITSAFRRSAATSLVNFNTTSNNNLLYAGTPSATNVVFYDGTNADQTLAAYQTRVAPREAGSVSEVVNFLSTTGSSALFLNIDSTITTMIEATGGIIPGINKDYNGKIRAGNIGYTGNSGLPDLGAFEGNYTGNVANQMILDSANADQYTGIALKGTNNVKILRVRVHTQKGYNALQTTVFALGTSSTTAISAISNAKIYYTASDSTFTNPQLFGTAVPSASYNISGSVKLAGGANYFWVTYDISPTAAASNFIDAAVNTITINGSPTTLINGDPTGNLQIKASLSGSYTVGASFTYPTLTAAMDELSQLGVSGPVTFLLMDALYNATSGEVFPITLKSYSGSSAINTVTIVPSSGIVSRIESANTTATLDFNGGANFIIDGRMGGTGVFVPGNNLIIENISTTAPAIRFVNEATGNKILYTDLRAANMGAATVATAGVVNFGTTTGTNGNDSNNIRNCDIHAGTAGFPAVGISTIGSASTLANNDNNRIEKCNVYDFYSNTASSAGIYVGANNSSWVIKNNHVYQTAKRIYTHSALTVHRGLWITPNLGDLTTASGFSIDSNYIGGNLADGSGMYEMTGNNNTQYLAIDVSVGKGFLTTVQGNTITNFSDSCAASSSISFGAINMSGGKINCNGNVIGSRTINGAITFTTHSATNGGVMGIRTGAGIGASTAVASTDTINITNNTIGGINMSGSSTTTAPEFFGVNLSSGARVNLINNLIGDTLLTNSINIPTTSGTSITVQRVSGVFANSITAGHSYKIFNNTIANITNAYESATTVASATRGIYVGPTATGTDSVMGNLVKNISTASRVKNGGVSSTLGGIVVDATASTSQVVTGNTIHSLTLANFSVIDTMNIAGIIFNVNTTGNNVVSRNSIHSLSMAGFNPYVIMNGLNLIGGNTLVANNMISLGFDNLESTIYAACSIRGILKNTGATNIYFNTVRIGGTGVASDPNRTIAFQRIGAGTDDVRNNIFINTRNSNGVGGGHLAVGLNNATTLTQNNNIYKADSFGVFNGTGQLTFANWQAATVTLDVNSKDTTVNFVSANNLHLAPNMNGVRTLEGVVISGITQDIDGQTRSTIPYIGADEVATHPLPVEFLTVNALVKVDDVLVSWATASEQNNKGFEVERSVNGRDFDYVNFVAGAGNSTQVVNYQLTDAKVFNKTNSAMLYYRIKQIDMDGRFTYSDIVKVSKDNNQLQSVSVSPNPFVNTLSVSVNTQHSGNVSIEVTDIQGRLVGTENVSVQAGSNTISLSELNDLHTGIYFVKITISGESQVVKVVKQ